MTAEREAMTLERQAFEKWAKSLRLRVQKNKRGVYSYADTTYARAGWKAAVDHLSRAAEPVGWLLRFNDPDPQMDVEFCDECPDGWVGKDVSRIYEGLPPEPARDANNKPWTDGEKEHFQAAAELILEREETAKDAARYRWLAEHEDADLYMENPGKEQLDRAIDSAMAQESGE